MVGSGAGGLRVSQQIVVVVSPFLSFSFFWPVVCSFSLYCVRMVLVGVWVSLLLGVFLVLGVGGVVVCRVLMVVVCRVLMMVVVCKVYLVVVWWCGGAKSQTLVV